MSKCRDCNKCRFFKRCEMNNNIDNTCRPKLRKINTYQGIQWESYNARIKNRNGDCNDWKRCYIWHW